MFMGFSIISTMLGGTIIICYGLSITYFDDREVRTILIIILIVGIVEFGIGIWAAVCLCLMKPCTCCYDNPPQQVSRPRVVAF